MNTKNSVLAQTFLMLQKKEQENNKEKKFNGQKYDKKRMLVRSDFATVGKYNMPLVKKQNIELDTIDLMSYNKTKNLDNENIHKTIHFFTYDWLFDAVYDNADKAVEKLKQYYALLTPDFSTYIDMPLILQMYSTFKNRWCGAYWQSLGLRVIPTIEWGDERSFDFCFDGIEQGSVVAIGTYGRKNKEGFLKGYNKMFEIIKPSAVICYGEGFPGMKGNIKFIDPYNAPELIKKIGREEYVRRYFAGDLYPEN